MKFIFFSLAVSGISYISVMIVVSYQPVQFKNRFRQQLSPERLSRPFQSEMMQTAIKNAGWKLEAQKVNLFRFFVIVGVLLAGYVPSLIMGRPFSTLPMLVALLLLICTSSFPLTPSGWVLRKLHQRQLIRKDGELIAFLKLYENNRMKPDGYMQFDAFCLQVAAHFEFIQSDLHRLAERVIEDGLESALDWFVSLYPRDHPFVHDIRTIVITVENLDDYDTVAAHLKTQSSSISKISSDQYARRWKFIGDVSTIFTSIPSVLIFLMIVVLVLLYVNIVRGNFNTQLIS